MVVIAILCLFLVQQSQASYQPDVIEAQDITTLYAPPFRPRQIREQQFWQNLREKSPVYYIYGPRSAGHQRSEVVQRLLGANIETPYFEILGTSTRTRNLRKLEATARFMTLMPLQYITSFSAESVEQVRIEGGSPYMRSLNLLNKLFPLLEERNVLKIKGDFKIFSGIGELYQWCISSFSADMRSVRTYVFFQVCLPEPAPVLERIPILTHTPLSFSYSFLNPFRGPRPRVSRASLAAESVNSSTSYAPVLAPLQSYEVEAWKTVFVDPPEGKTPEEFYFKNLKKWIDDQSKGQGLLVYQKMCKKLYDVLKSDKAPIFVDLKGVGYAFGSAGYNAALLHHLGYSDKASEALSRRLKEIYSFIVAYVKGSDFTVDNVHKLIGQTGIKREGAKNITYRRGGHVTSFDKIPLKKTVSLGGSLPKAPITPFEVERVLAMLIELAEE